MTRFKLLSVAAILSTVIATPGIAQQAVQEPGLRAFYQSLGVGSGTSGTTSAMASEQAFDRYDRFLGGNNSEKEGPGAGAGIARELARIGLPLSTYTQWYWKIDLHNLFHFLSVRVDPHAQLETRAYARMM